MFHSVQVTREQHALLPVVLSACLEAALARVWHIQRRRQPEWLLSPRRTPAANAGEGGDSSCAW